MLCDSNAYYQKQDAAGNAQMQMALGTISLVLAPYAGLALAGSGTMAGMAGAAFGTNAGIGLAIGGFDYNEAYTGKNPVKDFLGANTYEDVRTISNLVSGETVIAGASGVQAIENARRADEIGNISQNANVTDGVSIDKNGTGTTRVGRWMSQDEYDKMVKTGKVQMSGDNKVHVANPADINAFEKQAPKGSIYVEFDVPSNTISKGGTDGWGIINGPGSLLDRLNAKKGLPRITEMPDATNISIKGIK